MHPGICTLTNNFNPRSHERSDPDSCRYMRLLFKISIHAPTRGATLRLYLISRDCISIHAPTRGATQRQSLSKEPAIFQSTLPREERHRRPKPGHNPPDFNPRSHERSDASAISALGATATFQSTLPREERP